MRIATLFVFSLLYTLVATPFAQAAKEKFKIGTDEFTIDVPKEWNVQKDFFFPVGILSPDNPDNTRTVIGITPGNFTDDVGMFEKADKDLKPYIEGRKEWLAENGGEALSFDPYEKQTWKGIEAAHVVGYRYSLPTGKFHSQSYYILCNGGRLFHFKTLVSAKYENAHNDIVQKTVRTFQCTGKTVAQNEVRK